MDEVPLTSELPLTWTVNRKGESDVALKRTGHERMQFISVPSCTASRQKLPLMVIFKCMTMPKATPPTRIVVKVNTKGWMEESLIKEWLTECYGK